MGFALPIGALVGAALCSSLGVRGAGSISATLMVTCWLVTVCSRDVTLILIARAIQGLALGVTAIVSPAAVGEYAAPSRRGACLATISLAIASGVLFVHTIGFSFGWRRAALACSLVAFLDLLIIYHTPEAPGWLASRGRHDESRRAFIWLRGNEDKDELELMIRAEEERLSELQGDETSLWNRLINSLSVVRERSFYMPVTLMCHLYILNQWAGANILASYAGDVYREVSGPDVNIALLAISSGVQRIISNTIAVHVIGRFRRRPILFLTCGTNAAILFLIAVYVWWREETSVPIGFALIHAHVFTIATGSVPMPNVLAGELIPPRHRPLGGGLGVLVMSVNLFASVKTAPPLLAGPGLPVAYIIYGTVVTYCLVFLYFMLPETKDRTLLEIEEQFEGRRMIAGKKLFPLDARRYSSTPALF